MIEMNKPVVFWSWVVHGEWRLIIAATAKGLYFVGSPGMQLEDLAAWVSLRNPDCLLHRDDKRCELYTTQIIEYLAGNRTGFTIPMDLRGTPFQLEVWNALLAIPYGQTVSYSDISIQIGKPSAVRAVGAAIGKNPLLITAPCHRVIAKNGALTGYRGGLDMKEKLLKLENLRQ